MKKAVSLIIVGMLLVIAGEVYAVEVSAPNRTLKKTWIKTQNNSIGLSDTFVDAFTLTKVTCPKKSKTCTLRIEVSSQFKGVDPGEIALIVVHVDGSGVGVHPGSTIVVSDSTSTRTKVSTFAWMKTVTPGPHTVDVNFQVLPIGSKASAIFRTLTIEVYEP